MTIRRIERTSRRAFLGGLTLAGTAGLIGVDPRSGGAQPPPETSKVRLAWPGGTCQAPKYVADELLRAEGFTDVQYTHENTPNLTSSRLKALSSGETDFDLHFGPDFILAVEMGQPIVIVAGAHIGCYELFGAPGIKAIRDLKGKAVGVRELGSSEHLYLAIILAYVGLDPKTDVRWVTHPPNEAARRLADREIDAWLGFPPRTQELRARKIGHVILASTSDPPWRHYFCCMLAGNREFVQRNPVATKRVVRAVMKANQVCALEPDRSARLVVGKGDTTNYDYALQTIKEIPYGAWRDYDPEAAVRFYALRLHEAGMIKSTPQKIIARGTDWRFLNELKKELKG